MGVTAFPGLTSGIHHCWPGPTWTGASCFLTGKTLGQAAAADLRRGNFGQAGQFRAAQLLSELLCWRARTPTPGLVLDAAASPLTPEKSLFYSTQRFGC